MKTSKTLLLTAAVGLTTALTMQAQTLFFDFGASSQPTAGNYNNLFLDAPSVPNAIDSLGFSTGIGVVAVTNATAGFQLSGANTDGTQVPTGAAAIFDPQATRDSFFGRNTLGGVAYVNLTGLNPSATYNFTFFASRIEEGDTNNRETKYEVQGLNSGFSLLNPANNTSNVALVSGISPDAFGNLLVTLTKGPNNDHSSGFFYLGAMQIVAVPEPSILALAGLGGLGLMLANRRSRVSRS
jgi:hypothetical protein